MKKTYACAATAIFFWSTIATVTKLLLGNHNNFQVMWLSTLFAALFLLCVNIVTGDIKKLKEYKLKDYFTMTIIGLPGNFLYYVFYYAGTDMMPASQAFIINYLWPIMSVLFACILLKEKISVRKIIAITISFLGVGVVVSGELMHFNKGVLLGALFCVLGAVSYGLFTALNQKIYYTKPVSMMISLFSAFILTSVINISNQELFVPTGAEIFGFAYNGIFTIALASTLWVTALEKGNTAKISNLAYITPFLSLIWTSLLLKEKLNISFLIGLVFIVVGIFVQLKDKSTIEK